MNVENDEAETIQPAEDAADHDLHRLADDGCPHHDHPKDIHECEESV